MYCDSGVFPAEDDCLWHIWLSKCFYLDLFNQYKPLITTNCRFWFCSNILDFNLKKNVMISFDFKEK